MESILECSLDGKGALENLLENNDIEVDATSVRFSIHIAWYMHFLISNRIKNVG